VIGLGLGLSMVPALDAVLSALPAANTGGGSALTRALQNVAASFGVAVLGSVLNSSYRASLEAHLAGLPAPVRTAAEGSLAGAATVTSRLPAGTGRQLFRAAAAAYAQGMSTVMLVCAAMVVIGAVLVAVFLPSRAPQPSGSAPVGRAVDASDEEPSNARSDLAVR
jgi:hypothetical protein